MMKKLLFATGLVIFAFVSAYAGDTPASQVVSGLVVTQDGSQVPNASVQAVPIGGRGTVGNQSWVAADKEGRFAILIKPGRYQIRAKAEDGGYPDPNFLFSADASAAFPSVEVSEHGIDDVRVVLGSKGALLEGEVRDEHSGRPLQKAKVTISDANEPHAFVEVFTNDMGQFHFVVLAKPIVITAAAVGYTSPNVKDGERVTLSPGERRRVVIRLDQVLQDSR
jgi:hypothetical protein